MTDAAADAPGNAVAFACDAGHLAHAWVAARRIIEAEPGAPFDVVVASPDIDQVPGGLMAGGTAAGGVRFVHLDPSALPDIRVPKGHISRATFFRLLLPAVLGRDYRMMLYMDTDTWLRRPGIGRLFEGATHGKTVAAVPDFVPCPTLGAYRSLAGRMRARAQIADQGGPNGEYWQAGVLLIDCARFEAENFAARVLATAVADQGHKRRARLLDQSALNRTAAGDIALLDPRWNWHNYRWLRPDLIARFDPYVLHFAGAAKPWHASTDPVAESVRPQWEALMRLWSPDWQPRPFHQPAPGPWKRWRARNHRIGPGAEAAMARLIATAVVG